MESDMDTLVLLGAGASYASGVRNPDKPPLAFELFDRIVQMGGAGCFASTLPGNLQDAFRADFEAGMARLFAEHEEFVPHFQRELAFCLASYYPLPENLYGALLKALGTRKVIYASLNYDLLFESAARGLGISAHYGMSKPGDGFFRLLKIHGSSNFWPVETPMYGCRIKGCIGPDIDVPVKALSQEETVERCRQEMAGEGVAPAMAMFEPRKRIRSCPSFVKPQLEAWGEVASRVSRIYVCGVRVREEDTHIWDVLAKSSARLTYFGFSEQDRKEFFGWRDRHGRAEAEFRQGDFAAAVGCMR